MAALTAACTALTSDDLPMPRAPHSKALLAARPLAKRRRVFVQDVAHAVDALEQRHVDPVHPRDRLEMRRPDASTKASAASRSGAGARSARAARQRRSAGRAFRRSLAALPATMPSLDKTWCSLAGLKTSAERYHGCRCRAKLRRNAAEDAPRLQLSRGWLYSAPPSKARLICSAGWNQTRKANHVRYTRIRADCHGRQRRHADDVFPADPDLRDHVFPGHPPAAHTA